MARRRSNFRTNRGLGGAYSSFRGGRPGSRSQNQRGSGAPPKPNPAPQGAAAAKPPPKPAQTFDSQYTADIGQLNYDAGNRLIDIDERRDRLGFDTGLSGLDADNNGELDLDPRNAYSQAMHLQRMWEQSRSGTSVSMAARGQLYSGARARALEAVDYDRNKSFAQLQEGTRRGYEDLTTDEQRTRAYYNPATGTGIGQAQAYAGQSGRWQDAYNEWFRNYG